MRHSTENILFDSQTSTPTCSSEKVHQYRTLFGSDDRSERIKSIDAARGSAMLFVFLAHFTYVNSHDLPAQLLYAMTRIASPAFLSISGVMLGILYSTRKDFYRTTKTLYFRRGIFLLTLGRALIIMALVPMTGSWGEALRWGPMTDAIGFCFILGPLLVGKLSRNARVNFGFLLFCISWVVILTWTPVGFLASLLKETFFGSFSSPARVYVDVFPLLPWLGLYVIATSIGEVMGQYVAGGKQGLMSMPILRIGAICIAAAGLLFGFRFLFEPMVCQQMSTLVHLLLSPFQKLPPGPVYFLFYGGCAFLMLFSLMRFREVGVVARYSGIVEVIGRNSLFVFILQYFVYFSLFPTLNIGLRSMLPLYFVLSVAGMWCIALLWEKRISRLFGRRVLR